MTSRLAGLTGATLETAPSVCRACVWWQARGNREPVEEAREVFLLRLGSSAWEAIRGEGALEAGVRGDDRAPGIGLGAKVFERVVDESGNSFGEVIALALSTLRSALGHDVGCGPRRR